MRIKGREVASAAVIGLGRSNLALIRFLKRHGVTLEGRDKNASLPEATRAELSALAVPAVLGPDYLSGLDAFDALFLTPGMRKDLPELAQARRTGVLLSSEIGLLFERCRAPIIGVTGSSGKTTTTSLLGEIFARAGRSAWVGGNIGTPLIERADDFAAGDVLILELSSFQLEGLGASPHVAVVTNLTPNHLDVHDSMEAYVAAKREIARHQGPGDSLILNAQDARVRAFADGSPARVFWFGAPTTNGAWLEDETLWLAVDGVRQAFLQRHEIRLLGRHNVDNVLAAATAAVASGIAPETVSAVARAFRGVPNRLELVGEIDGVRYVNDSIATAPERAAAGVRAFAEPIVLIAGGYDKRLPFDPLAEAVSDPIAGHAGVVGVVTLGATATQIERALKERMAGRGRRIALERAVDLADAVARARALARPGSVVLLSPACASYDMFPNFEARAAAFRALVAEMAAGPGAAQHG